MVSRQYVMRIFAIMGIAFTLLGCTHGREYRLYVFDANRQLFIRDLEKNDVLSLEQAGGLICQKPEDVKKSIQKPKEKKYGRNE